MVLGHGSRTRLLTCRLSTDRHHIRTPAHKAPWVSRTPKCNQLNQIGKVFHSHDPRYLPDYLGFLFIKWLADCHRDRVTRRIGVCRSASCPVEGTVRCAEY